MDKIFAIAAVLACGAVFAFKFLKPKLTPVPEPEPTPTPELTPTPDLTPEVEPVVLQGTGIRYLPYVVPIELGGGLKEWGKTPDGETVISKNDPRTYQPWEWY